jgi:mitochondrial intermediate peptidase
MSLIRLRQSLHPPQSQRHLRFILRVRNFGLCGVPWARDPQDLSRASAVAISFCNEAVLRIQQKSDHGLETLHLLDSISNALCKVLDLASFVRENHERVTWRDRAGECVQSLGSYMFQLNAHKPLHDALVAITSSDNIMLQLTSEQRVMARLLQAEFERDGIHLPNHLREHLISLHAEVSDLSALFQQNIREADSRTTVHVRFN